MGSVHLLEPAPPDSAALREQLNSDWRETVDRLTLLSIELHSRANDPDDPAVVALDAELASLRQTMRDVEDALRRLR